jgi:hypothetical protein
MIEERNLNVQIEIDGGRELIDAATAWVWKFNYEFQITNKVLSEPQIFVR